MEENPYSMLFVKYLAAQSEIEHLKKIISQLDVEKAQMKKRYEEDLEHILRLV